MYFLLLSLIHFFCIIRIINMPNSLSSLKNDLQKLANPRQAELLGRFFKTRKGEYGEGDVFLGIKVPVQRQVAKKYLDLELSDIQKLISSEIHEYRLVALLILVEQFKRDSRVRGNDSTERKKIFKFYLKNYKYINNWDLVDLSASRIVGEWLKDKPKDILYKLAVSKNIWQKRIAIISTFTFIYDNQLSDTFKIAEILLNDKHDLIHKAVGWMLREAGKRDEKLLKKFLDKHCKKMPRTMLRYSIEKFNKKDYLHYLLCSKT